MSARSLARIVIASVALASAGAPAAFAQGGDIYSRLMDMREMDKNKDGMISKQEFLDMISAAWDAKVEEMKVHSDNLSPEHIKELEKTLGRVLSAQGGR
jgi:hypothetical protein